jgi:hypothetical protein
MYPLSRLIFSLFVLRLFWLNHFFKDDWRELLIQRRKVYLFNGYLGVILLQEVKSYWVSCDSSYFIVLLLHVWIKCYVFICIVVYFLSNESFLKFLSDFEIINFLGLFDEDLRRNSEDLFKDIPNFKDLLWEFDETWDDDLSHFFWSTVLLGFVFSFEDFYLSDDVSSRLLVPWEVYDSSCLQLYPDGLLLLVLSFNGLIRSDPGCLDKRRVKVRTVLCLLVAWELFHGVLVEKSLKLDSQYILSVNVLKQRRESLELRRFEFLSHQKIVLSIEVLEFSVRGA